MPIPAMMPMIAFGGTAFVVKKIAAYNDGRRAAGYNTQYNAFIVARAAGIRANGGGLAQWLAMPTAAIAIRNLLNAFGMNARKSALVNMQTLSNTIVRALATHPVNVIDGFRLPLQDAIGATILRSGSNLGETLATIYEVLAAPGCVTTSGGYIAASKTMHCFFPELAPMIDGTHTGISYCRINPATYSPPIGGNWEGWLCHPLNGLPNPSPRGAGRNNWGSDQLLCAIGATQAIYEAWQTANGSPGLAAFMALDPTSGTTGIPRIVDKILW
jgi:hypothetical protein